MDRDPLPHIQTKESNMTTTTRNILIHLAYMKAVTGGQITTVQGWANCHGMPYSSTWRLQGTRVIHFVADVRVTEQELEEYLPRLDYVYVFPEPFASTTNGIKALENRYYEYLVKMSFVKKAGESVVPVPTAEATFTLKYADELEKYSKQANYVWTTATDANPKKEHLLEPAPAPTPTECKSLTEALVHLIDGRAKDTDRDHVRTLTFSKKDSYRKALDKINKILNLLCYVTYRAPIPYGKSFSTRDSELRILYVPEPEESHNTGSTNQSSSRVYRETARKEGKTLRQEHAAAFADYFAVDFETQTQLTKEQRMSTDTTAQTEHSQMVDRLFKPGWKIIESMTSDMVEAWHAATGISGEAGELLDAIKKYVVYGKEVDVENVIEELGDLEFYMEALRQNLNITREQCLLHNMDKLEKSKTARYKEGYTDQAAIERADKQ